MGFPIATHDGEVQAEMLVHLILPLEDDACRGKHQNTGAGIALALGGDEEACLNGFTHAYIIGDHVAEAVV